MNTARSQFGVPVRSRRLKATPPKPPVYGLGQAAEPSNASTPGTLIQGAIEQAAPIVSALVMADSTQSVEVLKQRVDNHIRMRNGFGKGTPFWTLYDNRVKVLQAKYRAAVARQARDREDRSSRKGWSALGKVGIGTGIVLGVVVIGAILKRTRSR